MELVERRETINNRDAGLLAPAIPFNGRQGGDDEREEQKRRSRGSNVG